jgi:hypothetical protein
MTKKTPRAHISRHRYVVLFTEIEEKLSRLESCSGWQQPKHYIEVQLGLKSRLE